MQYVLEAFSISVELLTYEHPGNSFFGTVINKPGHLLLEGAILARFLKTK